jgi:hypothetical protein
MYAGRLPWAELKSAQLMQTLAAQTTIPASLPGCPPEFQVRGVQVLLAVALVLPLICQALQRGNTLTAALACTALLCLQALVSACLSPDVAQRPAFSAILASLDRLLKA